MQTDLTATHMKLGDYFLLLRRHWLSVVAGLLVGGVLTFLYLHFAPREYTATTSVLVTPTDVASTDSGKSSASSLNLDTEAQLVTATDTAAAAAKNMHEDAGQATTLAGQVTVSVPPNTDILNISFIGTSPQQAQQGARAFAKAYLDGRRAAAQSDLKAQDDALQSRINAITAQLKTTTQQVATLPNGSPDKQRANDQTNALNQQLATLGGEQNAIRAQTVTPGRVVTDAALPSSPSSPNRYISIVGGVLIGLLLGLGIALLRHRADDVIRAPEDLYRRTRVPVATVLSTRLHEGDVSLLPPLSADGRGYARLRNLVVSQLQTSDRRVVLVAGVRRGSGPVAVNLAASLARSGEDVVLVCADVFGSTAQALFGRAGTPGLAEVLAGERTLDEVVRQVEGLPNLRILTPGSDPDRADALLQTRSPRKLVDEILTTASYVVVEVPATTASPDAQTLANVAEIAVVPVELGQTTAREVVDACAQFESMGTPVLGGVVVRYGRDVTPAEAEEEVEPAVGGDVEGEGPADEAGTALESASADAAGRTADSPEESGDREPVREDATVAVGAATVTITAPAPPASYRPVEQSGDDGGRGPRDSTS